MLRVAVSITSDTYPYRGPRHEIRIDVPDDFLTASRDETSKVVADMACSVASMVEMAYEQAKVSL